MQAMIRVENLAKSYGDRILFDNITFSVNQKERIGLVGQNGHGKTTLFRMISGEERPDSGAIVIPKNYQIVYVQQHLAFSADTALEEGILALPAAEKDHHWKVEKILAGLGFDQADFHRPPAEFSGGLQVRLNLVKALVAEPDLLLLDEPTNFLDITSIRWIEQFLCTWPHELMVITHDRSFMDKVVTHTIGIHRRKSRKIKGDTTKYYTQIAQDEEVYEKTRINDERRRKEIQQFITRFRAKARLANLVQSRIKTLQKMEKKDKLDALQLLDFSFRSKPFPAKQILSCQDLTFGYDEQVPLISDFGIMISAGERVCVVGKNGKGKTTLLKLLAQKLKPQSGQIKYHPAAIEGFFEQTNISSLIDDRTVEEEILYTHADIDRQNARNICGAMMFSGDEALKKIGVLSGGEKSRVMLGKLLATPVNLLLLDEPTNHLDMESCDALLTAIDLFPGAVIIVTHNEMFLHSLAERLIVFQDEQINVFEGRYQEFLDAGGWHDERPPGQQSAAPVQTCLHDTRAGKKEMRRKRSEIISRRSKAVKPLENRISQLESDIESQEFVLENLNQQMQQASQNREGTKIQKLSQSMHSCQTAIDELFDKLEKATDKLEAQKAEFDQELQQLVDGKEGEKVGG